MPLLAAETPSIFSVSDAPTRPRSDIVAPIFSLVFPGLDQWIEGQYSSAALYTGVGIVSVGYAAQISQANRLGEKEADDDPAKEKDVGLDSKGVAERKVILGLQTYQAAGGLSAYHAFRTAVRTRASQGQYQFLTKEETPGDLLLAPFHGSYILRPTTFIPLGLGAAIMARTLIRRDPPDGTTRDQFRPIDGAFAGALSYNAGTHEEAIFRGWMMPAMNEYWGSELGSNAAQALVFAAFHLSSTSIPLPQLLLGYHLGYVTQRNRWSLGESIFIHAWWDVLAFATMYHFRTVDDSEAVLLPLWLPPLEWHF